jgi:hypothetical protein
MPQPPAATNMYYPSQTNRFGGQSFDAMFNSAPYGAGPSTSAGGAAASGRRGSIVEETMAEPTEAGRSRKKASLVPVLALYSMPPLFHQVTPNFILTISAAEEDTHSTRAICMRDMWSDRQSRMAQGPLLDSFLVARSNDYVVYLHNTFSYCSRSTDSYMSRLAHTIALHSHAFDFLP